MADQASERIRIAAPAQRCFDVAIDFEHYPQWARDVKRATIVSRDAQGRVQQVAFRAAALGKSVEYTLAYDWSDAPRSFSWELVEGGLMLRRLDGTYRFESEGDDATRVHYDLVVDLKAPLPRAIKHRAAALIVRNALRELKRHVEAIGQSGG